MRKATSTGSPVTKPAPVSDSDNTIVISHDRIAALAYEYWEAGGDNADENWLRAERELAGDGMRAEHEQ